MCVCVDEYLFIEVIDERVVASHQNFQMRTGRAGIKNIRNVSGRLFGEYLFIEVIDERVVASHQNFQMRTW